MEKRSVFVLIMVLVFCMFAQNAGADTTDQSKPRVLFGLDTGVFFNEFGLSVKVPININFEYLFYPFLGVQVSAGYWVHSASILVVGAGWNVHIFGYSWFDLYAGMSVFILEDFTEQSIRMDLPVAVGMNVFVSQGFGIVLRGRTYLLSLSDPIVEVNLGFVFAL